jgi:hypothetical protein
MTTDFGKTWKPITGDLPASAAWVHVVREDPKNPSLLYIGTEMGAYASWDKGAHWFSLRGDLPIVPIRDIQVHSRDNDILLATHGRGLYILDDATGLQQMAAAENAEATLFDVRPAIRWSEWSKDGNLGQKQWAGQNPPAGALITYYLKSQPPTQVDITISDAQGKVVRRMRRVDDDQGVNRTVWDLKADLLPGTAGGGGRGGGRGGAAPAAQNAADADTTLAAFRARRAAARAMAADEGSVPEGTFVAGGLDVLPGTYTVALSYGGKTLTKTVKVELDPRSDMTVAQLATQQSTAQQMNAILARVNGVINGVDDLIGQLTPLQAQLRKAGGQPVALANIDTAVKDLRHFRDSVLARPIAGLGYRQYPRLREEAQTVSGMVSRPMMPPTEGELLRMGELSKEADQAQARLDGIVQTRIAKINQVLGGTPHVIAPAGRVIVP